MAEKKKFEKPQMEAIKLNTEVRILAGSGCGNTADCSEFTPSRFFDDLDF